MASETLSWVDRRAANKRAKVGLNFLFDCSEDAEQLRSLRSSPSQRCMAMHGNLDGFGRAE
jgi:hypothetical protein